MDIDQVDRRCSRIMDVKCHSSGEQASFDPGNLNRLTANDQVKFVIENRKDFDFATKMVSRLPACLPSNRVLFSTVFGRLPLDQLARWMLDAHVRARLQVQLHKVIWPDRDRGV
jgi:7-carboxy-7-deazaguanine synthase